MEPNVYCSLCGVLLAIPDPATINLPKPQRPWYYDVRATYKDDAGKIALSGVGYLVSRSALAASQNSEDPFPSSQPNRLIYLNRPRGRLRGYGLHDDCWVLLLEKLSCSHIIVDESTILEYVYQLFYYTECPNYATFSFGHNYGGAAELQDIYQGVPEIPLHRAESASPLELPSREDFDEYASTILNAKTISCFAQPSFVLSGASGISPIHKLPQEIFYLIIQGLTMADVTNFRATCQDFAWKTNPINFPPSFWRARFQPGFELEYVLPGTTVGSTIAAGGWFTFFCGIMKHIHRGYKPLVNKKRIWNVLEHIARIVKLCALRSRQFYYQGGALFGLESHVQIQDDSCDIVRYPGDCRELPVLSTEGKLGGLVVSEASGIKLAEGCEILYLTAGRFSHRIGATRIISVSTIHFGGKCYISGFGALDTYASRGVGMRVPGEEDAIHIPSHVLVESIEVAFRRSGLAGIRFLCTGNHKSRWVGQNEGPDIGRGIVRLSRNNIGLNIVAGLDPYKIVSLESTECHPTSLVARDHIRKRIGDIKTSPLSYLWSSKVPDCLDVRISLIVPELPNPFFDPLVNIDFGGPVGETLKLLTKMTVHMISERSPIVGMEFEYGSECTRLFGTKGRTESSALIDGPGGERITSIGVFTESPKAKVLGLLVKTNRNHYSKFTPLQCSLDIGVMSYSAEPPCNQIITGFATTRSKNEIPRHFERMGLQYRGDKDPDILHHVLSFEKGVVYV